MIWTLINLNFKTFKNIPIMVTSIPPCLKFKGFLNNNFGLKFLKEKKKTTWIIICSSLLPVPPKSV